MGTASGQPEAAGRYAACLPPHARFPAHCSGSRSGVDIVTVSRRLGHGNPSITLTVYAHLFSNTDERAADVVETAFVSTLAD
jgi:hypothetical protein